MGRKGGGGKPPSGIKRLAPPHFTKPHTKVLVVPVGIDGTVSRVTPHCMIPPDDPLHEPGGIHQFNPLCLFQHPHTQSCIDQHRRGPKFFRNKSSDDFPRHRDEAPLHRRALFTMGKSSDDDRAGSGLKTPLYKDLARGVAAPEGIHQAGALTVAIRRRTRPRMMIA